MSEMKVLEGIYVDEVEFVERAIYQQCGKNIDFELIKKFIRNEKNTMFYLDEKLHSSTKPGTYNDYLWLDTGFRDHGNNPIMICLKRIENNYVGHYTSGVRTLADRVKQLGRKKSNAKDVERNYSRFLEKYMKCVKERRTEIIGDTKQFAIHMANANEEAASQTMMAAALSNLDIEFAPELEENLIADNMLDEAVEQDEYTKNFNDFSALQNEITVGLVLEQMEKMQDYIDELVETIKNIKEKTAEEIESLTAQNIEYKQAMIQMRDYTNQEEQWQEKKEKTEGKGHCLLGKNEKILVLGNTDIKENEMRAIARDLFGFKKDDFEFITDYAKVKGAGRRIHKSERFAAVIFGNCPHKVAGIGDNTSIIEEFNKNENCTISVDARNSAGDLKITKSSFKAALLQVCSKLNQRGYMEYTTV